MTTNQNNLPMSLPIQNAPSSALYKLAAKFCGDNPIKQYADYRDELPESVIDKILDGDIDDAMESMWEYEIDMQDSCYEYRFPELLKECLQACDVLPENYDDGDIDKDYQADYDDVENAVRENIVFDFSGFWDDAARNTTIHVAVTPLDPETGDALECPHYELDFSENMRRARRLNAIFGIKKFKKIEPTYPCELLKLAGSLDISEILKKGKMPDSVTIAPRDIDNLLFHDSLNGAGNMGVVAVTKIATIKARFRNDKTNRHGIDAVYSFTSSYWSHDIQAEFSDDEKPTGIIPENIARSE